MSGSEIANDKNESHHHFLLGLRRDEVEEESDVIGHVLNGGKLYH